MENAFVLHEGSRTGLWFKCFSIFLVFTEIVKSQRLLSLVNIGNDILNILIRNNRENRAENFFIEHSGLGVGIENQSGWEILWFFIEANSSVDDFATVIIFYYINQSLGVEWCDDPGVVRWFGRVFSIEILDGYLQFVNEFVQYRFFDHQIVGGNTGLAGVAEFTRNYSQSCTFEIGISVDDCGTLAAQFKNAWHQIIWCSSGDETTFLWWSSENDQIPWSGCDNLSHFNGTLENSITGIVEVFFENFSYNLGAIGG